MARLGTFPARLQRAMHVLHARRSGMAKPITGLVSQPEPRSIGSFAKGRQLAAGNLMFAGHLIEAPNAMIWDIDAPDLAFAEEIHGFAWMDDLAAVGDTNARKTAQEWLFGWIDRYDTGRGPGWIPDLTGRRIIRWVHHANFLAARTITRRPRPILPRLGSAIDFLIQTMGQFYTRIATI